jgi:hypothetical protein
VSTAGLRSAGSDAPDGTSPEPEADERVVPRWTAPAFLLISVLLVPWIVWLFIDLPDSTRADHWSLAWGGFDVMLALSLAGTAVAILRRSTLTAITATIAGTLLVCDAWFDVLTSKGGGDLTLAILMALLLELPLAALCFAIAHNVERILAEAARTLRAAGFRVRDRRLVPPGRDRAA